MSDKPKSLAAARAAAYIGMVTGCGARTDTANRLLDDLQAAVLHDYHNPPETIPCKCGKVMMAERHICKPEYPKRRKTSNIQRPKCYHSKILCSRSYREVEHKVLRAMREKDGD